ncbi:helicase C-terminal domain-containing protein [Alicyclobacillus dauci]|uniref:3'-5' exonuclease DinG n=1 Tax=Alicyclobacillus dauci TaxID=1475485 RepID=A0ABY6Z8Z0_9BACL|nr:helicase C-terminal domain-containing protein [Alicyclobacillus dauci]WAH39208.1 exonuclease domain-containing protein [Alicyclobacillus dauci]
MVLDIETTGFDPAADEIIEIGAVRVTDGQMGEQFQRLIRPTRPISETITQLTGITNDMVENAEDAESVLLAFLEFVGNAPVVAHNLEFDVPFLQRKYEDYGYTLPTTDGLCTLVLSRILLPTLSSHRLGEVAAHLQVPVDTVHRALDDAMTCAQVFGKLSERAATLPLMVVQQFAQLAGLFSPLTGSWFGELANQVFADRGDRIHESLEIRDGLTYTARTMDASDPSDLDDSRLELTPGGIGSAAYELLADNGPLSQTLPGYEARQGQLEMVEKVSEALEEGKHAVIEAGTGTGKSMAYLIPAALYAASTGSRVLVSTHTLALQDQIEQRDFPTLQQLFHGKLNLAVQKGRKNYVCLRKVNSEAGLLSFASPAEEIQSVMALLSWLTETRHGVREELSAHAVNHRFWTRVQSETDTCINKRCPFFRPCYYFRAKARAQVADVVVTNHSLLLSDLKADHRVLPKYDALVIDEAHHLEEQATKHLGGEVHGAQLGALAHRLSRDRGKNGIIPELLSRYQTDQTMPYAMEERLQRAGEWVDEVSRSADVAVQLLGSLVPPGKGELRLTPQVCKEQAFTQFTKQMADLRAPIKAMRDLVKALHEWSKQASTDEAAGRILDAAGFLDQWVQGVEMLEEITVLSPDMVTWIEKRGTSRPRISVHTAPIDVSQTLRHALFEPLERVVLTSATLSIKGNFDYTVSQLGLKPFAEEDRLITANVSSPFDYGRQARLCVPSDVPELAKMSASDAAAWLADSLYQLAVASQGRVLALFTSHQMLRETAKLVREPLRRQNLSVFAQDVDGGRQAMLDAFRKNPRSILLGAQSFWEGIDLPGDQLTTLVIVRLPFAPPSHPVTEARHERLTANGKSPFWVASLPEAVVRFRQGFGRLIRTRQDKGVVVVYDKRVVTQRYGQTFIQSLPGVRPFVATEQEVLKHIRTFLAQSSS